VQSWSICRQQEGNMSPCHVQRWKASGGTPGECLFTAWLVENGIKPADTFVRWQPHTPELLDLSLAKISLDPPAPAKAVTVRAYAVRVRLASEVVLCQNNVPHIMR
jgi:hypothetical protein